MDGAILGAVYRCWRETPVKVIYKQAVLAALLTSALTLTSAQAQTPDRVQTRIGELDFERGYPTEDTVKKVYDELDYQRAVQAYLWAYPAVSFESIRVTGNPGADFNHLIIADKFVDPKSLWLTANDTTIYAQSNIDLAKTGPVVMDIPPGALVGIIDDFWQRSITDVGMPGPDGDKGGKFLLLPPGYSGEVPSEGYHVLRGTMNNYNFMIRGIVVNNDVPDAVQRVKKLKLYRWDDRANPPPTTFTSFSGREMNTLPPTGMEYWARLSNFINNNPAQERDRFFMAMLKPLGIEKGKPFQPDARQRAILEDAARIGDATARTLLFDAEKRISGANAFSGTNWNWVVMVNPNQEAADYSQLDERLHYTYGAIYTSPFIGTKKAGPGSTYVQTFRDKDGNRLDGGKSYRLHVPAKAPAAAFWSLTIYDTDTRSMIQNPSNDPSRSGYDKMKTNADGSVDLYFGPKAPAGLASNWIETIPGKGYYPMFRFYTPTQPLFDGSWKLPDIELMK